MIVIDLGSNYIKYGISGNKKPKRIIMARIYKYGPKGILSLTKPKEYTTNEISYIEPIKGGIIINYEYMDMLWSYIFEDLKDDINIVGAEMLISEPVYVSLKYKNKISEHLKNKYHIKTVFTYNQQYLSLLGCCNNTTSLVIDIGYTSVRFVPIYEGYIIIEAITLYPVSKKLLHKHNRDLNKDNKIINKDTTINKNKLSYIDTLLDPLLLNLDELPIIDTLYNVIKKCPIDLRKHLYENILIVGGGASYDMTTIFTDIFYKKYSMNINITVPSNKNILTWLGGSIASILLTSNILKN